MRLKTRPDLVFARQAQIADRDRMRRLGISAASTIGESVELFDIAEWMAGLRLTHARNPVCSERWANSNGPLGSALALAMVMIFGSPSVTATRTATRSAVIAFAEPFALVFCAAPATSAVRFNCWLSNIHTHRRRRAGDPNRAYRGRHNRDRHSCRNGSYRNSPAVSTIPVAAACRRPAVCRAR